MHCAVGASRIVIQDVEENSCVTILPNLVDSFHIECAYRDGSLNHAPVIIPVPAPVIVPAFPLLFKTPAVTSTSDSGADATTGTATSTNSTVDDTNPTKLSPSYLPGVIVSSSCDAVLGFFAVAFVGSRLYRRWGDGRSDLLHSIRVNRARAQAQGRQLYIANARAIWAIWPVTRIDGDGANGSDFKRDERA
jgi:hypothetical protein